jgi:GMP synthase (glutamine-hydrolysing)
MIAVLDFGSQYTNNIATRIRELSVFSEIFPYDISLHDMNNIEGIILSGGPNSVYDNKILPDKEILEQKDIPVLGICYGMQAVVHMNNGLVKPAENREYGKNMITIIQDTRLLEGLPKESVLWMSHGDIVTEVPEGFLVTALSEYGYPAAVQKNNIYALQGHPEVHHSEYGRKILDNFLNICNAERTWTSENMHMHALNHIREKVQDKILIGGVSGGVDSSVAAYEARQALGDNFYPIFVDNGLLRKNEADEVMAALSGLNLRKIDAQDYFLDALIGITNPEHKRKIIGERFIRIFEQQAADYKASYLLQGTIYPDVVESGLGINETIKTHHNVGGIPDDSSLILVEPFRRFFKYEVRQLAEYLGLPDSVKKRHPFPGPGLAVRCSAEITKEKLELLREADHIFIEELKKNNLYDEIGQAFAVITDTRTVGVAGDKRTEGYMIALRAVNTDDFMTASVANIPNITDIADRIVNEVPGINRVVYDVTSKPPGTIEWE